MEPTGHGDGREDYGIPAGLASPWRRLSGYLIDCLLFSPLALALVVWASVQVAPAADEFARSRMGPEDLERYVASATSLILPLTVGSLAISGLLCLYYFVCLAAWGRTLGGQILSLRCVSASGGRASVAQVAARQLAWFGFSLCGLLPGGSLLMLANYLWMLWDPRKQALMDKAGRTLVVDTRHERVEG